MRDYTSIDYAGGGLYKQVIEQCIIHKLLIMYIINRGALIRLAMISILKFANSVSQNIFRPKTLRNN